ncbi:MULTISPECIES: hypothetical protein [unclassified Duganella]|uniref:hypothetical protein n=1 Tax=unclassified Duganella TaxID=2636909 RepID=UPI0011C0EE50|nr:MULTISPECIES: hypothetical protein [unclassified Duganella]
MMRKSVFSTLLLLAFVAVPASGDEQRVRLITASHLPQAARLETVYAGKCGEVHYKLVVSPENKTVAFSADGMPDADLSGTTVGARLLEEDVLVHVGFNCPHQAINIFLKGVKLVDLGAPTGFRDSISVRSNGEVSKSYPRGERLDELAIAHPAN